MKPKISDAQIDAIARAAGVKAMGIKLPEGVAPKVEPKAKRPRRELPEDCLLVPRRGRWTVTIPDWHPASLNQLTKRGNHYTASSLKRNDAITIGRALKAAGVPAATMKRRVGLVIVLGKGQRGCDGDAYHKSLLDGLQRCRALTGDNRQRCEILPVQFEKAPTKASRVTLEDVGE